MKTHSAGTAIDVRPARGPDLQTALAILLQEMDPRLRARQIDEALRTQSIAGIALDGLLLGTRGGEPVGALLLVMQPDGCGFVWPPVIASHVAPERIADALLQGANRVLDDRGAWIGQCLFDEGCPDDETRLTRNAYTRLTELTYLQRDLSEPIPAASSPLEAVRVDPVADERRLGDLIERTYDGSQDCPGLTGLRSGLQAVRSHRFTGVLLPDRWFILREGGRDAGVLILADQPDQDAWELVYMGVTPAARGRGLGERIVRLALCEAREAGRQWLLLAVDRRNAPARRVYEAAGFTPFDEKVVFVRPRPAG